MQKGFGNYHPLVNFIYFLVVLLAAFFLMHPVCLGISFVCAFFYALSLMGKKILKFFFFFLVPMMLFSVLINPLVNHQGVTILTYLPGENPLTLESIYYGLALAVLLGSVLLWFSAFNQVMSSDKIMYLFGKILPSFSLIISMVLRFVPKFKSEIREISFGQECIGKSVSEGSLIKRIRTGLSILSMMATRSMEEAITTSDSMRSRGFGQGKRTAFSNFSFTKRDQKALILILILAVYLFVGVLLGTFRVFYVPVFQIGTVNFYSISVFVAYFLLGILPLIFEWKEERAWLKSK